MTAQSAQLATFRAVIDRPYSGQEKRMKILSFCVVFLCITLPVYGQVEGRLIGSVLDTNGQPVADAAVSLKQPSSNVAMVATVTTSEGLFTIPAIRPDLYDL